MEEYSLRELKEDILHPLLRKAWNNRLKLVWSKAPELPAISYNTAAVRIIREHLQAIQDREA